MTKLSAVQKMSLIKKSRRKNRNVLEIPKQTTPEEKEIQLTAEQFVEVLQKNCSENTEFIKNSEDHKNDEDYIKIALIEAEQIWMNVQVLLVSERYQKMSDDEKISLIQKDFKDFYKNFPVVSRYMICLGQYKMEAFRKMLIRCKTITELTVILENNSENKGKNKEKEKEPKEQSESKKDFNEKLWIERQSDYVRFLWEEYQEASSFTQSESYIIWKQAFDNLTSEFNDFREMHEKIEKKIKEDTLKHKKELLFEMSDRIISGKQTLDVEKSAHLVNKLQGLVFKQRYKKVIDSINDIPSISNSIESIGTNDIAKDEYDDELKQAYYKKNFQKMDVNKLSLF